MSKYTPEEKGLDEKDRKQMNKEEIKKFTRGSNDGNKWKPVSSKDKNPIVDAQNDLNVAKDYLKNEYHIVADILEKAGSSHGFKAKGEERDKYMKSYLNSYLDDLSKLDKIKNRGLNNEIINAFKQNIDELVSSEKVQSLKLEDIAKIANAGTKITRTGWKTIADLLGDNKLGNFFNDLHEKSVQKGVNKLAGKLVDQNLDLKKISGALKDAGMSHGGKGSPAPVRSAEKHQQEQNQTRGK